MSEFVFSPLFKIAVVLLCVSSTVSHSEQVVEVANKAYWICKSSKQVRTVRVSVNNSGICTTYYSKDGAEKTVGSGKNHESCINFLNNVKTNLEKSNWTCRDISATRITASTEE